MLQYLCRHISYEVWFTKYLKERCIRIDLSSSNILSSETYKRNSQAILVIWYWDLSFPNYWIPYGFRDGVFTSSFPQGTSVVLVISISLMLV